MSAQNFCDPETKDSVLIVTLWLNEFFLINYFQASLYNVMDSEGSDIVLPPFIQIEHHASFILSNLVSIFDRSDTC